MKRAVFRIVEHSITSFQYLETGRGGEQWPNTVCSESKRQPQEASQQTGCRGSRERTDACVTSQGRSMGEAISISVSIAAFAISAVTAWLTLFRQGTVRMTQPTIIYFGYDKSAFRPSAHTDAKVFLRTLLYATSKRGRVIENMFVRVHRAETSQTFSFWAYDEHSKLERGSGLFIGENGVAYNHHFVLPSDGTAFHFLPGEYRVEVFASLVGDINVRKLHSVQVTIPQQYAESLTPPDGEILFDWLPEAKCYYPQIRHASVGKLVIPEPLKVED